MRKNGTDLESVKKRVLDSKVFLFDFDGTLVNLDKLNVDAFAIVFREMFNLDFTRDDFMKYVSGRGSENGLREYLEVNGVKDFDSKKLNKLFYSNKSRLIEEKLEEEVYLLPGIGEFLKYFDGKKRNVVVTSSRKEHVERMLTHFDILHYFEVIFDRYSVVRGKPDPLPYLKAIEYTNVDIEGCIAFEDSFYGLQSSKGAGLFTVGVVNKGWNEDFVYDLADFTIETYTELLP